MNQDDSALAAERCGELEVEVIKLRREVDRARQVAKKQKAVSSEVSSALTDLRKLVNDAEVERELLRGEIEDLERETGELGTELQDMLSDRDRMKVDMDLHSHETETLRLEKLRMEAEIGQMAFFHDETDKLLVKLRMNAQTLELEREKEVIEIRHLEEERQYLKSECNKLDEEKGRLKVVVQDVEEEREKAKYETQMAGWENDQLHDELESLGVGSRMSLNSIVGGWVGGLTMPIKNLNLNIDRAAGVNRENVHEREQGSGENRLERAIAADDVGEDSSISPFVGTTVTIGDDD